MKLKELLSIIPAGEDRIENLFGEKLTQRAVKEASANGTLLAREDDDGTVKVRIVTNDPQKNFDVTI